MVSSEDVFDFIVAGGGTAGCVIASRLSQYLPQATIVLVEAGPDAHDDERVQSPALAASLHRTELQWNYETVPQADLDNRKIYHCGGRLLSGSSAVNYGGWTRGAKADFDTWAALVGDARWSYNNMLKYFKRSESSHQSDEHTHGFTGPIHTTASPDWPLTNCIRAAFADLDIGSKPDVNSGEPFGLGRWTHAWHDGKRQPAGLAYDLSRVTILTNTCASRLSYVIGEDARVDGVELSSGKVLRARKEVIVCCGAFRTPQLLMLSGIGPRELLESHSVVVRAALTEVGCNLHDRLALGSPLFPRSIVNPVDWVFTEEETIAQRDERACSEIVISYSPASAAHLGIPRDGSIISTGVVCLSPTSRGTVVLASTDIHDSPIIDPQYVSTKHDRSILRRAMRKAMQLMSSHVLHDIVSEQWSPDGSSIDLESSDEDLDRRIRATAVHWYHAAGTASMGSVVDPNCRVLGAQNLRVCDASVIPLPITGHIQATVYALAEQCAEIIAAAYKSDSAADGNFNFK